MGVSSPTPNCSELRGRCPANPPSGSKKKLNFDSLDKALTAFRLPARRVTTNVKNEPSEPDTLVQAEHQDPPPHQASPDTSRPPPRPIKIESDEVMKSEEVSDDVHNVPLETFDETSTYRRVDLVFAPPVTYWTAVVGWWVAPFCDLNLIAHCHYLQDWLHPV